MQKCVGERWKKKDNYNRGKYGIYHLITSIHHRGSVVDPLSSSGGISFVLPLTLFFVIVIIIASTAPIEAVLLSSFSSGRHSLCHLQCAATGSEAAVAAGGERVSTTTALKDIAGDRRRRKYRWCYWWQRQRWGKCRNDQGRRWRRQWGGGERCCGDDDDDGNSDGRRSCPWLRRCWLSNHHCARLCCPRVWDGDDGDGDECFDM